MGSLPIPQLANDTLYIDFIQLDPVDQYNYVLTMVDSLTRFCKFVPCRKTITGEETLRIILTEWIQNFDKPCCIMSDNDVRFSQETSFYRNVFKQMGIQVKFSIPRHPASNGLCERTNRSFLQNLRALTQSMKTMNWPKLVPVVTWIMNSQISVKTGYSASELFLGRPSWKLDLIPEPDSHPKVESFLQEQMDLQEAAMQRLKILRQKAFKFRNKNRKDPSFQVGDYVLVSRNRWPQRKLRKTESQWFGPFKVTQVHHNSLRIAASPNLGGEVLVTFDQLKHWNTMLDYDDQSDDENDQEADFQPDPIDIVEDMDIDDTMDTTKAIAPESTAISTTTPTMPTETENHYEVDRILKHKYQQGWKFLTSWKNYPVSTATWEPPKHFVMPNGEWNQIFMDYLIAKGLTHIIKGKNVPVRSRDSGMSVLTPNADEAMPNVEEAKAQEHSALSNSSNHD